MSLTRRRFWRREEIRTSCLYEDLTVEENLEFFAKVRKIPHEIFIERKGRLLGFSGLSPFLRRRTRHLSGGMQKKLALCCNLIHEPDILVLDEPTLGVDPISRRQLWDIIRDYHSQRKTIVVATSCMDEAARCRRVAFLLDGKVLACSLMERIIAAMRKEYSQFLRDWLLIALILWTYTIEVVLCVYALTFDVNRLKLAVYDQDRTQVSQRLIDRFISTEYFSTAVFVSSLPEIDNLLDAGKTDMRVVLPSDFSKKVIEGSKTEVQILLSGTNSNTASVALDYARAILASFSRDAFIASLARHGLVGDVPEVEPRIRIWYNPELQFRYFMVISMIVVAGLLVGIIHTAASVVREKEAGTIEQLGT